MGVPWHNFPLFELNTCRNMVYGGSQNKELEKAKSWLLAVRVSCSRIAGVSQSLSISTNRLNIGCNRACRVVWYGMVYGMVWYGDNKNRHQRHCRRCCKPYSCNLDCHRGVAAHARSMLSNLQDRMYHAVRQ